MKIKLGKSKQNRLNMLRMDQHCTQNCELMLHANRFRSASRASSNSLLHIAVITHKHIDLCDYKLVSVVCHTRQSSAVA